MKIKKVDDKPMVIHTKEKAKIHSHEPKGARIKGSNIYTVERGPKIAGTVTNQVEGGQEVTQAAYLAYEASRPVTGTASKGAALVDEDCKGKDTLH